MKWNFGSSVQAVLAASLFGIAPISANASLIGSTVTITNQNATFLDATYVVGPGIEQSYCYFSLGSCLLGVDTDFTADTIDMHLYNLLPPPNSFPANPNGNAVSFAFSGVDITGVSILSNTFPGPDFVVSLADNVISWTHGAWDWAAESDYRIVLGVTSVPEPGTAPLLCTGVVLLGLLRLRRWGEDGRGRRRRLQTQVSRHPNSIEEVVVRRLLRLSVLLALCGYPFVASAAKPPPPPPPPATGCSTGVFPAVVLVQQVPGKGKTLATWDIYVGNDLGTCRVKVFTAQKVVYGARFRFDGSQGQGRIIWAQQTDDGTTVNSPVIKNLAFSVSGSNIVEPLPLAPTVLWRDPASGVRSVIDVAFNPGGGRVAFLRNHDAMLDIGVLDVGACTSSCPTQFIATYIVGNTQAISWPQEDRIYFTASTLGSSASFPMFVYAIDGFASAWSSPRTILSGTDSIFPAVVGEQRLINSVRLPVNSSVMAVSSLGSTPSRIDVLDVSGCSTSIGAGSCFANGDAQVISVNSPGRVTGWTTDGYLLRNNNPASFTIDSMEPATGTSVTNYGNGEMADGGG